MLLSDNQAHEHECGHSQAEHELNGGKQYIDAESQKQIIASIKLNITYLQD